MGVIYLYIYIIYIYIFHRVYKRNITGISWDIYIYIIYIYIYIKYDYIYIYVFFSRGVPPKHTFLMDGFPLYTIQLLGYPFILGNLQMGRKLQSVSKYSLIHLRDFESCVRFLTSFHQAFNFLLVGCAAQSHDFHPD